MPIFNLIKIVITQKHLEVYGNFILIRKMETINSESIKLKEKRPGKLLMIIKLKMLK